MGHDLTPEESPKRKPPQELLWEELVEVAKLYLRNKSDREMEEYFAEACLKKITVIVKGYVAGKRLGDIFIDEGISHSQSKLTEWMRGEPNLDNPEKLKQFLIKMAKNATVDAIREWFTRTEPRLVFVPLERESIVEEQVEMIQVLDRGRAREDALCCSQYQSAYYQDPERLFKPQEEKQIFSNLINIHAQQGTRRDKDCAFWILARIEERLSVDDIASQRGTTPDDVRHLFKHDQDAMIRLYREHYLRIG